MNTQSVNLACEITLIIGTLTTNAVSAEPEP